MLTDTDQAPKPEHRKPRRSGRPAKGEKQPNYSYLDRLLVHGEEKIDPGSGKVTLHYPTYRELAKRLNISHTSIYKYAKKHNCLKRREEALKRKHEKFDKNLAEFRAEARALSIDDELRMVDDALLDAWEGIKSGRLRISTITDLNLAIRLKKFLMGDVESRHAMQHGFDLEELQARHRESLKRGEALNVTPTAESPEQNAAALLLAGAIEDEPRPASDEEPEPEGEFAEFEEVEPAEPDAEPENESPDPEEPDPSEPRAPLFAAQ